MGTEESTYKRQSMLAEILAGYYENSKLLLYQAFAGMVAIYRSAQCCGEQESMLCAEPYSPRAVSCPGAI